MKPSDQAVAPDTIWQHKNGGIYCVHVVTNTAVEREGHAPDVVYQCVKTWRWWRRPLSDWHQSFTRRADLDAQPQPAEITEQAKMDSEWAKVTKAWGRILGGSAQGDGAQPSEWAREFVARLVHAGRLIERYENPVMKPLSPENFRIYDSARRTECQSPKELTATVERLLAERDAERDLDAQPSEWPEADAWMLRRKRDGFIRGAYVVKPCSERFEIAEIDGDEYAPLYTRPTVERLVTERDAEIASRRA